MTVYQPGDIGLCKGTGLLDRLIEVGERIHGDGPWSVYSHAFVIVSADGGTVEAQGAGVIRSTVASHGTAVTVFACPPGVDRATVVGFAEAQLGDSYGYLDDALLGVDCLLRTQLHEHTGRAWICSELAAAALEAGGWVSPLPPALTMPADLARLLARLLSPHPKGLAMTATTTTTTTSTAPTGTSLPKPLEPVWLTHLIGALLVAVPVVLAVWQPGHSFHTAAAQAAIVVAGVAAAGLLHLVHLVVLNGLTKAGVLRSVHEEAAWLHSNWSDVLAAIDGAKSLVGSVDPALLHRTEATVAALQSQVGALTATSEVGALSATNQAAVEATIRKLVIPGVLQTPATTSPAAPVATPTPPATPVAPTAAPAG